jgi:hypothetical protein
VLNFLEGTRRTPAKLRAQNSPFQNLLKPKTGGLAFVLECMGEQFDSLLDVSIVYPREPVTLWSLLTGRIHSVKIDIRRVPIPTELLRGDYLQNQEFRDRMQGWVAQLWSEKDARISKMKSGTI